MIVRHLPYGSSGLLVVAVVVTCGQALSAASWARQFQSVAHR